MPDKKPRRSKPRQTPPDAPQTALARFFKGDIPETPETWEEAVLIVAAEAVAIMYDRHYKYGPGNISAFGEFGLVVRLSDKVQRLLFMVERGGARDTLATNAPPEDFADEAVEDTYTDFSGYGFVGKMWRRGWWNLPIAAHHRDRAADGKFTPKPRKRSRRG